LLRQSEHYAAQSTAITTLITTLGFTIAFSWRRGGFGALEHDL